MRGRNTIVRRALACALLATALVVVGAASAFAAPTEPVMGLDALQAKLEANGGAPVHGYFKTVLKGSTISVIPVDVLGITSGINPDQSLILFEAADLADFGGVAEGMSGSPLYVDNAIVGAVSYGDAFSLRGTALATPIEYMTSLEGYGSRIQSLEKPVLAGATVIDKIVLTSQPSKYSKTVTPGTMIATPLMKVFVAGVNPSSTAYKRLADAFSRRGISLSAQTNSSGEAMVNGVPFSAPLVGGASVADMLVRGDVWGGGIGTVTYANGNDVVAFGHSAFGIGDMYLSNAYIDGIRPSSLSSYKTGRPGVVRGRITQDNPNGIGGVIGATSEEAIFTGRATNAQTRQIATTASYSTAPALNIYGGSLPGAAVSYAAARLNGWRPQAGSAETTTTIKLRCDDMTHTIVMSNVWDSGNDIASATGNDAYNIVNAITGISSYGLQFPVIESVDVESQISSEARDAQIADVRLGGPLKAGDNKVTISLFSWGVAETRTVEATLTIPEGVALDGEITASCAQAAPQDAGGGDPGDGDTGNAAYLRALGGAITRPKLEDVLNEIDETVRNNVLTLSYQPVSETDLLPGASPAVTATVDTQWVLNGEVTKSAAQLTLFTSNVNYGDVATVEGSLDCGSEHGTLSFFGTTAGETTETLLAQIASQTTGDYFAVLGPLKKNTKVRAVFSGSENYLNAQVTKTSGVYAKLRMSASNTTASRGRSVNLSVSAQPVDVAGSRVVFQRYNSRQHRWVSIATKTLGKSGTISRASVSYRVSATTKVRAHFMGGKTNVATNSSALTLRVK